VKSVEHDHGIGQMPRHRARMRLAKIPPRFCN
jgi:hypothetical protein